ncbi:hypothetical protein NDR89_13025 [Cupriavidus gilardii]|uniref:Uncharacterized protein n=1 Tax=Cupriavidus gilardii TaxID=82541 RepID=A0ABY4VXR6_9BURK|nr:hypothetical protein [Cupriavidus gilardii]USE80676.1 hypothetical protein NDR89_13025 [Cupriavidus gilardii]
MLHASTSRSSFNTLNPMDHARRASAFIARTCIDSLPSDAKRLGQFAITPGRHPAEGIANACKSVNPEPVDKTDMLKTLKARNLSVHGAHVYHVGIPLIMLVASAYAANRITRKVFFETLDLFVRHAQRDSDHPGGIKPHHLTRLGISATDAKKLPLCDSRHNIVLVAGLLNGVIDMEDFELLYGPGPKGRFLQRHFPGAPVLPPAPPEADRFYCRPYNVLIRDTSHRKEELKRWIPLICADLEEAPDFYISTNHYKLRLLAAENKGVPLSVLGPFDNEASMRQAFADTFHVVHPDYEPNGTWCQDAKSFRFVEPKRIDWIPPEPKKAEAEGNRSKPNRTCAELLCNVV